MSSARCIAAFRTNSDMCSCKVGGALDAVQGRLLRATDALRFDCHSDTSLFPSSLLAAVDHCDCTVNVLTQLVRVRPAWGPPRDRASRAIAERLHVSEHHTPAPWQRKMAANWENVLPPLPWGQVMAGSNRVSPTTVFAARTTIAAGDEGPMARRKRPTGSGEWAGAAGYR